MLRNRSKMQLDVPSNILMPFAVGILVWVLSVCNQLTFVFFVKLVRCVRHTGQLLRLQPYRQASLCPMFLLFGEGKFEFPLYRLVYNAELPFCVWICFFHVKILLWTGFEPHPKSLHLEQFSHNIRLLVPVVSGPIKLSISINRQHAQSHRVLVQFREQI